MFCRILNCNFSIYHSKITSFFFGFCSFFVFFSECFDNVGVVVSVSILMELAEFRRISLGPGETYWTMDKTVSAVPTM